MPNNNLDWDWLSLVVVVVGLTPGTAKHAQKKVRGLAHNTAHSAGVRWAKSPLLSDLFFRLLQPAEGLVGSSLNLSSLAAILSQWAKVMFSHSCRHSDVIFTVRNLARHPLNNMHYLRGFFFLLLFSENGMMVFAAKPMLPGASVRCPTTGKG